MAWPFSGVTAPNFDSGFVTLPSSLTNVTNSPAGACWLIGLSVANSNANTITIKLVDGAAKPVIDTLDVPANGVFIIEWPFMPASGTFQWMASTASGVTAKLWGYS